MADEKISREDVLYLTNAALRVQLAGERLAREQEAQQRAQAEVSAKYGLGPGDKVNLDTGEIVRGPKPPEEVKP